MRVLNVNFLWKTTCASTLAIGLVTGSAYVSYCQQLTGKDMAVIVTPTIQLRAGDGLNFPEAEQLSDAEGRHVTVLDQRGEWAQVRTKSGQSGWIPMDAVEVL